MNEMELLRELARETPLPAPAELDGARARLVAAITADSATYATAVAGATTSRPDPSAGPAVDPLRPAPPAPVLSAIRFMYGGAVGSAVVFLIAAVPFMGDLHGRLLGHRVTATPLSITLFVIVFGLIPIALWLWLARAVGQGRNWARIVSTVLFGLATLGLLLALGAIHAAGVAQAFFAALTWLSGLAAVWMVWRPASSTFFRSVRAPRPRSQISGP
jgi:hypothetical protein